MAINFPNSPAVNDTFTVGGINFTFTGVKWESGAVVELSSDTTPTLGGNLDGGAKNINNVGVITATGFSGPLTGAVTGNVNGNATGLTGDPSIQVTNATVLGNLDVQGTTSTIDTAITQVDSLAVEGSVGIGTTNPAYQLSLNGTGVVRNEIVCTDNSGDGAGVYFRTMDGGSMVSNATIRTDNTGNLQFFSGTSTAPERLRITSDGEVLILNTGNRFLSLDRANASTGSGEFNLNVESNSQATISYDDGANLVIGTSSSPRTQSGFAERLRITSAGTLQIGSSATINVQITPNTGLVINDGAIDCYQATTNVAAIPFKIQSDVGGTKVVKASITAGGVISDSLGPLRRLGSNIQTNSYTLVAGDAGKMVRVDNGSTITVPDNVFSTGDMITIVSGSSSNVPITQGSGLSLYNASDGTTGNKTLAARTVCTILIASGGSSAKAYIAGGGIS
nr:unnamed protein product [uncultured Mediterranean phage uvMED]